MTDDKPLIPGLIPMDGPAVSSGSSSGFTFSQRSLKAMEGIHPDLRKVCDLAIELTSVDFVITEGKRSYARQQEMVATGKSQTMNSRHLVGCAVDYVDYPGFTYDLGKAKQIADAFKSAAAQLGILIKWGGDWKNFVDSDHIELDRSVYPN